MLSNDLICGAVAAANYTGLEPRTIYRLCGQGFLPYVRLGHRLFFRKSELDQTFAGEHPKANLGYWRSAEDCLGVGIF